MPTMPDTPGPDDKIKWGRPDATEARRIAKWILAHVEWRSWENLAQARQRQFETDGWHRLPAASRREIERTAREWAYRGPDQEIVFAVAVLRIAGCTADQAYEAVGAAVGRSPDTIKDRVRKHK